MMNGVREPFYLYRRKSLLQTLQYVAPKLRCGNGDARQFSAVRSVQRTRRAWRSNLSQTLVHTYLELIQTDLKRHIAVASTGTGSTSYFHISRILAATLTRICASGCEAKG